MTLRTRTPHPSGATSGPGRTRLSDGRLRHRRGPAVRRGRQAPHVEPEAVRRRAEALLGGSSPPLPPPGAEPAAGAAAAGASVAGADPAAGASAAGPGADSGRAAASAAAAGRASGASAPPAEETAGLSPLAARRLALRERLPVWFQTRCGVEPRTVAAVGVVLVVAVGCAAQQFWSARPRPVTAPALIAPSAAPAAATAPAQAGGAARIVVDISGKVRDPGVRRLPAGSRVEDALAAAGGVRPGTDTTGLNRARVLVDGEQVLVGAPAQAPPGGSGSGGGPGPGPLSLGSATVEQLDGLPGVGPVLAQHIVDFRTARGGFRSVEELRQVNGIGERRFADLRTLVRP
ncbi:ComEA family DNA-binding protein [Streptomyces sp. NPDC048349]|uniref:ComEA family DNA-binding protein n=1 Tax=Streptomyces sp. NPDC048349 TaxID=3155486 RepID=UPI003420B413